MDVPHDPASGGDASDLSVTWQGVDYVISYRATQDDTIPTTSCCGFCFLGNRLLVVRHRQRGFDIPGGHHEAHETPEETLQREVLEEACVVICAPLRLGSVLVTRVEASAVSKYPGFAQMRFFVADIRTQLLFRPTDEIDQRIFVRAEDMAYVHSSWNKVFQQALDSAVHLRSSIEQG